MNSPLEPHSPASHPWTPLAGTPTPIRAASGPASAGEPPSDPIQFSPPRTLRVLHLVNGEHFAGAERVQFHLGNRLPAYHVTADFACLLEGRFAPRAAMLAHSHTEVVPMRNRFDLTITRRIAAQFSASDYDLLHAHTPRSALVAARLARKWQIPWVYHLHSPAAHDCDRRWKNWLNAAVEKWSLRGAAHLIAVSHSLAQHARQSGWPASRITVVHNGVPAERYDRPNVPHVGGPWVLGMIALLRPRKGLEVALESLALLRRDGFPVTLRCIGPFESTEYEQQIRARVDHLELQDAVTFEGFVDNVPAALAKIDMMVLPSLFGEGLPMVVLESMAAGVPVIATRVEGTPEAVQHGRQGLLAEPASPTDFADQIRALVTGQFDWNALSESAAQRHREYFSDDAMARATADVYRKVLEAPSATRY